MAARLIKCSFFYWCHCGYFYHRNRHWGYKRDIFKVVNT